MNPAAMLAQQIVLRLAHEPACASACGTRVPA
jgi:hypothetical protein